MANTYNKVYIQAVFAVKYRAAVLDKAWRDNNKARKAKTDKEWEI